MKAFFGSDPYRTELDVLRERMEKAGENVDALKDQLYNVLNRWDLCKLQLAEKDRQIISLQTVIENLRERINEKDEMIDEYQRRSNTD